MNIFTIFFYKISAKYSPKRTKLHYFLKFSRGSMPPNPPTKRVASPCKYPHFSNINMIFNICLPLQRV